MRTLQIDGRGTSPPALVTGALARHWPEYLMEAAGLGIFMISACAFGTLLEHPTSAVRELLPSSLARRALMGVAMAATAIGIIYSPWGKQSGAHLNPAVTVTFYHLGRVERRDAFWYVLFQFAGGLAGVLLMKALLGERLTHPAVNHIATVPGMRGVAIAFITELSISFVLMSVVLAASSSSGLARKTGLLAGLVVGVNIALTAPLSGMSMNPARTFASALPSGVWTSVWIYFVAPPAGMLLAARLHLRWHGAARTGCAKLHHDNPKRCIFCIARETRNTP